jgi:signal transduction histidine kinase
MKSSSPRLIALEPNLGIPEMLLTEKRTSIGRSRQNDLFLDDPSVSRVHAMIHASEGGYAIEDAGSLHGTIVNGRRVSRQRLAPGDVIQVGIFKLKFTDTPYVRDSQTTAALAEVDHLRLLLRVTQLMSSSLALDKVLEHVIDGVIQVTHAERGLLLMKNSQGGMEVRVARNFDQTAIALDSITASSSILDRVRRTGAPVVLSDTLDTAVSGSIRDLGLRSVMCVPLKTQSGLLGLIYVDSHQRARRFADADLELFETLASQAALAIEKSQLHEELQRHSTSLEEQVRARTAELIQSEKMAAIGRLAASIAHAINSPLGAITSNVDLLRHVIGTPALVASNKEVVDSIADTFSVANARLTKIIKVFQALTGVDQADLRPAEINLLIEDALTLIEGETEERIRVIKELGDLRRVTCSPSRISQVFVNLLLNAIQSIDGAGRVLVRSEQMDDRVRVTIRDTGRGMTEAQLATAFDPGFNPKDGRVSASLGLMVTGQIIRDHGGEIQIESKPGAGTTVALWLPNSRS